MHIQTFPRIPHEIFPYLLTNVTFHAQGLLWLPKGRSQKNRQVPFSDASFESQVYVNCCYMMMSMLLFIVINYINLFVFDDEIEMKNRSTIQTLTFVTFCTNKSGPFIHETGSGTSNYPASVRKKLAPCKNFSWLLNWLLTFPSGKGYLYISSHGTRYSEIT
jgi:hypothetical protein